MNAVTIRCAGIGAAIAGLIALAACGPKPAESPASQALASDAMGGAMEAAASAATQDAAAAAKAEVAASAAQ